MTEARTNYRSASETPLYGVAQVRDLTGLTRTDVLYLLRLGLVNPTRVDEHGRSVRKFSEPDLDLFRKAQTLRENGASPREIITSLSPEPIATTLLTDAENQVIRIRYSGRARKTFEVISKELGLAKQTVWEINESAVAKLARAHIMQMDLSSQS